jgi:hypothetical protein
MTHMQSMSLMVQISSAVRTIGSGTKVAAEVMHQMNEMSKKDSTMANINDFGKEAKELQLSVEGFARAALAAGAQARQAPAGAVRKRAGRPAALAPGSPLTSPLLVPPRRPCSLQDDGQYLCGPGRRHGERGRRG